MSALPYKMFSVNPRKRLTEKQKAQLFLDFGGLCCICGHKIHAQREAWDEHILPLVDGGTNDLSNRGPAHEKCARVKTSKEAKDRSRARTAGIRSLGIKKQSRGAPIAGGKQSRYKRKIDGTLVYRDTGEPVKRK